MMRYYSTAKLRRDLAELSRLNKTHPICTASRCSPDCERGRRPRFPACGQCIESEIKRREAADASRDDD